MGMVAVEPLHCCRRVLGERRHFFLGTLGGWMNCISSMRGRPNLHHPRGFREQPVSRLKPGALMFC
jgi:hypothetical protein